jgi:hypothetical protein
MYIKLAHALAAIFIFQSTQKNNKLYIDHEMVFCKDDYHCREPIEKCFYTSSHPLKAVNLFLKETNLENSLSVPLHIYSLLFFCVDWKMKMAAKVTRSLVYVYAL